MNHKSMVKPVPKIIPLPKEKKTLKPVPKKTKPVPKKTLLPQNNMDKPVSVPKGCGCSSGPKTPVKWNIQSF
jgi:hypothetical protein